MQLRSSSKSSRSVFAAVGNEPVSNFVPIETFACARLFLPVAPFVSGTGGFSTEPWLAESWLCAGRDRVDWLDAANFSERRFFEVDAGDRNIEAPGSGCFSTALVGFAEIALGYENSKG
jgi:hypothetical protein